MLAALRQRWRLGMATNRGSTVPEVMRRFGLAEYFDTAVGVLDVPRPKPHPDLIEACLARLDVLPAAAVYVGDARSDLAAAEAAGVHFVGVGDHSWSPRTVRELRELPALLDRLLPAGPAPVT